MRLEWSPLAVERVSEIVEYTALDSPMAAEKWVNAIFEKTDILVELPNSGRMVPELNRNNIREILFGNHRIIYRVGGEAISVLTVRHTRQILPIDEL